MWNETKYDSEELAYHGINDSTYFDIVHDSTLLVCNSTVDWIHAYVIDEGVEIE